MIVADAPSGLTVCRSRECQRIPSAIDPYGLNRIRVPRLLRVPASRSVPCKLLPPTRDEDGALSPKTPLHCEAEAAQHLVQHPL